MKTTEQKAQEIARLMEAGNGRNVALLNIAELNSWTDYFIIVTVTSSTQCQGLMKDVKDYIKDNDLEIHLTKKKSDDGTDWNLVDLGPIVMHLMTEAARGFYELERLWHAGTVIDFHAQE